MTNQRHLFELPEEVIYLNGAYMSPQLKSVSETGIKNLLRKANPAAITERDFFSEREQLKASFAELIHVPHPDSIAIIPSVSYGVANALKNIPFQSGDEIVVLEEQFPSNYYAWKQLEKEKGVRIATINAPGLQKDRARIWNEQILDAIGPRTRAVAIPYIHWADGTLFDLKAIRERTHTVDAYLIIDGTQSVGAMPFSVTEIQPDALICGGYKWLLGPYSLGLAYYGERFYEGTPVENNWITHQDSDNFAQLVHYNENFRPMANRYDVGESSNFILTPMLLRAIRQLLEWTPAAIQEYARSISADSVAALREMGCFIEDDSWRAHHLFGIYLPDHMAIDDLKKRLVEANIFVSYRGNAVRVSPSVYNSAEEMELLVRSFSA